MWSGIEVTEFSANLGFLWQELSLPDAIRAAKAAGFAAVECHWPYAFSIQSLGAALSETGLPLIGLNTRRGDPAAGDNGLAAVPERVEEARRGIDEAIAYAAALNVAGIHVMAGCAQGSEAERIFCANLRYACRQAAPHGISILIEPLNARDAPGYFLQTTTQTVALIDQLREDNLKLMFDCYHIQIMEGEVAARLKTLMPYIGHIQIAAVPDRAEPGHGELDYRPILSSLDALGYRRPVGAEYRPATTTEAGLTWMSALQ
jgi:hydroxypyruvate isomerase